MFVRCTIGLRPRKKSDSLRNRTKVKRVRMRLIKLYRFTILRKKPNQNLIALIYSTSNANLDAGYCKCELNKDCYLMVFETISKSFESKNHI